MLTQSKTVSGLIKADIRSFDVGIYCTICNNLCNQMY